jgi:LacI family transcriptional regulator
MKKAVTQKDIANALNISHVTVSRVFNNRGYISPDTKRRVLAYAEQVGFRANKAAVALSKGKTAVLAVITTDHPDFFWSDVDRGLGIAADQLYDIGVVVENYRVPRADGRAFLDSVNKAMETGADVVAVSNTGLFSVEQGLDRLHEAGIPVVMFNVDLDHPARVAYLGPDYHAAGTLAGEMTVKLSGPESRMVAIVADGSASRGRYSGFAEMVEALSPQRSVEILRSDPHASRNALTGMIRDVVSRYGDRLAIYCATPDILLVADILSSSANRDSILVGHDISPQLVRYLRDGVIDVEIGQNPMLQGYLLAQTMHRIAEDGFQASPDKLIVPSQAVLASNADERSALELLLLLDESSAPGERTMRK